MSSISETAMVSSFYTWSDLRNLTSSSATDYLMGNCTVDLMRMFNISTDKKRAPLVDMCKLFALSGSLSIERGVYAGQKAFLCASATQINMVSATVERTHDNRLDLSITRLPSDLHVTHADYWKIIQFENNSLLGNDTVWYTYSPSLRYTLADNPTGATEHYILPQDPYSTVLRAEGIGSAGLALATSSSVITSSFLSDASKLLLLLDEGREPLKFTPEKVTTWGGQLAASKILASLTYNGWVAENSPPILLLSTGGKPAVCYRLPFAAAFIPLFVAGLVSLVWGLQVLVSGTSKRMEELYGGIRPLHSAVCPQSTEDEAIFEWKAYPEPHLQLLKMGQPIFDYGKGAGSRDCPLTSGFEASETFHKDSEYGSGYSTISPEPLQSDFKWFPDDLRAHLNHLESR